MRLSSVMRFFNFRKITSTIATLALLANSLITPFAISAQEATFEPTPTPTETTTATPDTTTVSDPTVEPTPSEVATSSPEVTIEPSLTPDPVTPAPEETQPEAQGTTNENSETLAPPAASPSLTPTPTVTPVQPEEEGILTTTVVETGLFSESLTENNWFSLVTDKLDYAPTEAAIITGEDFTPNETYSLTVSSADDPATSTTVEVTTDSEGSFTYVYQLDGIYRPNYLVQVFSGSTPIASVTFTDGNHAPNPSADLDQWGNEAPIGWQNGNLNGNQADYFEGDSVAYRMKLDNLSLSPHTLTIGWDTTKGGKHALDYLTSYDRTETTDPCSGVAGCSGPASTFTIPADPNISADSNWSGSQIAGNFSLFGGTITGVSSYTLIGPYSGDSETQITITFTPTQVNPVLAWGGHIATRADWGQDNSAVSISGSPYHMRLRGLDGGGGNQDRSLASEAVIYPALITIIKDASPDNAQDFAFTTTGTEMSNFSLDDDTDGALSNSQLFSITTFANNNGNEKTITEATQTGWSLTGLVCDDNDGSVDLGTRTATLSVVEGEVITCTFTNTLQNGTLRVHKVTDPSNDTTTQFNVTATGSGTITGSTTQNVTGGSYVDYIVTTGTYSVFETPKPGWSETSNNCTNVSVPAGGIGECTITNTKLGKIIVEKQTNPDGSSQVFDFTTDYSQGFSLSDGQSNDSGFILLPDTYSVAETGPTGWDQTGATCTDGSTPSNIELSAGETVTCTFINTQRGNVSGYKYEDANGDGVNGGDWTPVTNWFVELWQGDTKIDEATTDGDGYYEFLNIVPGIYQLIEEIKAGWTNVTSDTLGVTLDSGEDDGSNNFVNTQYGSIVVFKQTIPDNSPENFEFEASYYDESFLLTDGFFDLSGDLIPGTYSVTELPEEGWNLTSATCDDGSDPSNISLQSGETVVCTFTNTRNTGTIIVHKIIDIDGVTGEGEDGDQSDGENWTIDVDGQESDTSNPDAQPTDGDGLTTFSSLKTGNYNISETLKDGYGFVEAYCDGQEIETGETTLLDVVVGNDDTVNCTFINSPNGSIHGQKWNDLNGDGIRDFNEEAMNSWRIFLDENDNQAWDDDEQNMFTQSHNEQPGWYWFEHLFPDTYTVCEEVQDGWVQTSSPQCHVIEIPSENACPGPDQLNSVSGSTCDFGNQEQILEINIDKSNDKSGGASAGDTVNYTLVVTNTGNQTIYNLDILDGLPGGFSYVTGSTSGDTTNDPTITGNGLTWTDITDLDGGESFTIYYQVKIAGDVVAGTYKNFATCEGDIRSQEETIECNVDDSDVQIGQGVSFGGDLTPQVLGISTELPATGSPTLLLIISLGVLGIGLFLRGYSKKVERKANKKGSRPVKKSKKNKKNYAKK